MLSVNSISRHYCDLKAVDNVSFSVERGEIVGLLGHNGAGKTTVMKMLAGFLEPDKGSIRVNDADVTHEPDQLQQSLGYLPESPPICPELSVLDFLDYVAELKGLSGNIKHIEINRAIESAELGDMLIAPIGTLSRGFKQRVGVAQAILGHPDLLILNEPTNGLDPSQTEQMRTLIRRLSSESTILLSTHIMQEVEAICDRVLIIQHGNLAIDSDLGQLTQSDSIHLSTNATIQELSAVLEAVNDISFIEKIPVLPTSPQDDFSTDTDQSFDYALNLGGVLEYSTHQLIAEITRRLVGSGYSVFEIRTEVRDLQHLFLELNKDPSNSMTGIYSTDDSVATDTELSKSNAGPIVKNESASNISSSVTLTVNHKLGNDELTLFKNGERYSVTRSDRSIRFTVLPDVFNTISGITIKTLMDTSSEAPNP